MSVRTLSAGQTQNMRGRGGGCLVLVCMDPHATHVGGGDAPQQCLVAVVRVEHRGRQLATDLEELMV